MFGQSSLQPGLQFGQSPPQPGAMFGQNPTQPSSLFGQPVSQPGSLFGQTGSPSFGSPGAPAVQTGSGTAEGGFGTALGFGIPSTASSFNQQTAPFGQTSAFGGSAGGFGQSPTAGFGQPANTTAGPAFFGQRSPVTGGFGQTSASSTGVFGQTAASGFGQQTPPRPSLFGQPVTGGFGQTTTASSGGLFGQTTFVQPSASSTIVSSSSLFTGLSTSSGMFGSGGSSAFQSTASNITGLGQTQPPSVAFGKPSIFAQQNIASTSSSGQPAVFGQSASATGLFGQPSASTAGSLTPQGSFGQLSGFGQQTTAGTAFGQTSAFSQTSSFGQPVSTSSISATGTSTPFSFGQGGDSLRHGSDSKPSGTGLFGKGPEQTSVSEAPATTQQSRTRLVSGGFPALFGKVEKSEDPTQKDQKPGLFGKALKQEPVGFGMPPPAYQKQEPAGFGKPPPAYQMGSATVKQESDPGGQQRSLFGKMPPSSQPSAIKQEKGTHQAGMFGKSVSTSESEGPARVGLFGKGSARSQQATTGSQPRKFKFEPTEGAAATQDEEGQEVKTSPGARPGLFGKSGPKPASKGLFGKPFSKGSDKSDTDESEGRGFRSRLTRVREDPAPGTSRPLFGRPVTQSTRQSRGSDEGLKSRRPSVSRQQSDDLSSKVAIVCRNVPTKFNNHTVLKNHFSRYGLVTKVFPNTAKMQATIHFERHEQAADAKRRGRMLARGYPPLTIFWSSYSAPLTPSPREPGQGSSQGQEAASRSRQDVPGPSKKYFLRRGDPVNEELDSMSGTSDLSHGRRKSPSPMPQEIGSRSPEKRVRSASPGPASSTSLESRSDKVIHLNSFQGVVARTTAEQVHLLELRDKYIRENRKKNQTDLKKAFVGTCPDMCPEKERYDREDKRRLSYYEMIPGTENIPGRNPTVDHNRAVKEYVRTSPHQDDPLSHELRPMPVLQMTMTYLLCEIADQGQDGFWGDWFDFLWNRTRGIRKDITQQQLSDRSAVELIEKCARFHIFCSERLCEEDMHSFDAKINNENLTKCLQTLREFYHDLERKQKVFCLNEAEFRAYTVLMNLNEGDILREVQQLRPAVRATPEISFALQVYSALNSNNYVRFFRLVKQSSFACACIMHRYFTQVRNRALTSMMRTYGMGNKAAQIPLSELVRLLGFEKEQEASDFSEHYGFVVEDGCVILDRNDYLEPETAWLPRRSVKLIESKRMVSVGEMINGEILPNTGIPQPSSSFDEHGRFRSAVELPGRDTSVDRMQQIPVSEHRGHDEVEGHTEIVGKQEPVAKATRLETPIPQEPIKPSFTTENVKDTAKLLFWEVIDVMVKEISMETSDNVAELLEIGQTLLENTVYSTVKDMAQTVSREVYDDAQAEHQRALKQEQEERHDRVAATLTDEFLQDILQEQVLSLATIEIRDVKAELKRESIARVTEDINIDIVQEVMSEMVQECAADVYETDVVQRIKQLQEFEDIIKLSRAGKFLRRWKKEYKAVIKLKRAMMAFPSAPSMENTPAQLDRLLLNRGDEAVSDSRFYVDKEARLTVETPLEIDSRQKKIDMQLTVQALYRRLLIERAWHPLDLSKLVGPKLSGKLRNRQKGSKKSCQLNWKLVMYLPEVDPNEKSLSTEKRATTLLCDWLKAKMSRGKRPPLEKILKTEVLSLYKAIVPAQTSSRSPLSLGICVRSISGLPSEDELLLLDEERCMLGTDALVFVLPANPDMDDPHSEYWYSNVQRLQELLEVKPANQDFPLVIIVAASPNQDIYHNNLSERLNLDLFIEQGFICDVKIVVLEFDDSRADGIDVVDPKISERLCESIQWLADLSNLTPVVTVAYLKDCIEGFLMEEYYTPVLQNLRKRKLLGHLHQDPEDLLELYNSVIQHLCDTLTSESLLTVSWPVLEFTRNNELNTPPAHWNTEDQFDYLRQLIQSLKLPQFVPFVYEPKRWGQVKEKVTNYVTSVLDEDCGPTGITLTSKLVKLLHQIEVDFEETCYLVEGVDQGEPTYTSVPWSELVSICIDYRLATLDVTDPTVNTQDGSDMELKVAYYQSELENFIPPHSWRHIESDQSILDTPSVNTVMQTAAEKVREKLADSSSTVTSTSVTEADQENHPPEVKETKAPPSNLIKSLQAERRRSDHFQKYLENALKSEVVSLKESQSDTSLQVSEWKGANADIFGDTFNTSGLERKEFSMPHYDPDISLGTRLFGNQTIHFNDESCFGTGDQLANERSITLKRKSLGHMPQNTKRLSLGVQGVDSNKETLQNRTADFPGTQSDMDADITTLPSRARRQRLSDVYGDDKVMFALCEPSVSEDIDLFKNEIKANRRESDLFEKKLLAALKSEPFSNESL